MTGITAAGLHHAARHRRADRLVLCLAAFVYILARGQCPSCSIPIRSTCSPASTISVCWRSRSHPDRRDHERGRDHHAAGAVSASAFIGAVRGGTCLCEPSGEHVRRLDPRLGDGPDRDDEPGNGAGNAACGL